MRNGRRIGAVCQSALATTQATATQRDGLTPASGHRHRGAMRRHAPRLAYWRTLLSCAAISLVLTACASLPGSGPRTADIEDGAKGASAPESDSYVLIDLNRSAARTVGAAVTAQRTKGPIVLPRPRTAGLVGAGDLLRVAIWQPNPDGTSLTADKSAILTDTRVDRDGTVGVPYIGRIQVVGDTPAEIESAMHARLATQSPGSQVTVLVTEDVTNNIIVQGQVGKPGRYVVVPNSSGLLDILAAAGGAQLATGGNAQTTTPQAVVRVTRAGTTVTRTLSEMIAAHALEPDLAPGDRILVQPRDAHFYAFGAVNQPGEQLYDADSISLARMLARIAGLADNRADPAEVFVYRRQDAELTRSLLHTPADPGRDLTRVIYRANLRAPAGFFISEAFPVLPDDLVYVSESPISEVGKVFQILTSVSTLGAIPRNLSTP